MSGAELVGQAGSLGLVLVVVDQPARVALTVPHWSGRGVHKAGVGYRVGRIRSLRVRHGAQVFLDKSEGFKIKSKLFSFQNVPAAIQHQDGCPPGLVRGARDARSAREETEMGCGESERGGGGGGGGPFVLSIPASSAAVER